MAATATKDLDSQLRSGIEMIEDAYSRHCSQLKHEISHWKHVAQERKENEQSLESQILNLTRRVSELENALAIQTNEKKTLISSKNALLDRYNELKRSASQLEAFRKNMISMIQQLPTGASLSLSSEGDVDYKGKGQFSMSTNSRHAGGSSREFQVEQTSTLRESNGPKQKSSLTASSGSRKNDILVTPRQTALQTNTLRHSKSVGKIDSQEFKDATSTFDLHENQKIDISRDLQDLEASAGNNQFVEDNTMLGLHSIDMSSGAIDYSLASINPDRSEPLTLDVLRESRTAKKMLHRVASQPAIQFSKDVNDLDPTTLYRHIREALSPEDFEQFANTVASFNSGKLSASQTVQNVHKLIGPGYLSDQMTKLILEAVRESSK